MKDSKENIIINSDGYGMLNFPKMKEITTKTGLKIQFGENYFCITNGHNYISEISIEDILNEQTIIE